MGRVGDVCMGCVVGRSVELRCCCCGGGMVREFGSFGVPCYLMCGCGLLCFRGGIVFRWFSIRHSTVGRV